MKPRSRHKFRLLSAVAALAGVLALAATAAARQEIQGLIEGNVTWTSRQAPYIIVGETVVTDEATLQIAPTVKLVFRPGSRLMVRGRLEIAGVTVDGGRAIDNQEVIRFESQSSGFIRNSILEDVELQDVVRSPQILHGRTRHVLHDTAVPALNR